MAHIDTEGLPLSDIYHLSDTTAFGSKIHTGFEENKQF